MTVELTPERATSTWHFVDGIRERSNRLVSNHKAVVERGRRVMSSV